MLNKLIQAAMNARLLIILFLLVAGLSGYTLWQQIQLRKHYGQFLRGANAKHVEDLLKNYSPAR